MDAAMARRERKQLNFSTIVDFSLSKQDIFFVTLRQQRTVRRQVLPFFFFCRPQKKKSGNKVVTHLLPSPKITLLRVFPALILAESMTWA